MYHNDSCKVDEPCCGVQPVVDSMKNTIVEIHDHALKAREMANIIYELLFGKKPIAGDDAAAIDCAYDALLDVKITTNNTLEVLNAVIERIGK